MGPQRPRAAVGLALLMMLFAFTAKGARSANGATTPWMQDHAAVGSLRFYDAGGYLVTSGSVSATPFAPYVQASVDGSAGDTLATLWAFTPEEDVNASQWQGAPLSGPTPYPNSEAPPRVNGTVLPVVTGRGGDTSLSSYIAKIPNRSTSAGFAGIYELRLYTSRSETERSSYSATYIAVKGGTWEQVYPGADSTTVALVTIPEGGVPGATPVTILAKLTPATVGGSVTYYDGGRPLGTDPNRAIQAALEDVELDPGNHALSATFRPDTTTFEASSGNTTYLVGAPGPLPTTTDLTVDPAPGPIEEGTTVTLTATVDPNAAPGSIDFLDDSSVIASVPLDHGAAAYATTTLKASEHHLGATYHPSSSAYAGSSAGRVGLKVVKRKNKGDDQTIRVRVPKKPRVLGQKITRGRGILGVTGAPLIAMILLGAAGLIAGAIAFGLSYLRGRRRTA